MAKLSSFDGDPFSFNPQASSINSINKAASLKPTQLGLNNLMKAIYIHFDGNNIIMFW
jgi:hypothetical protein